jgi:hypothetical protein
MCLLPNDILLYGLDNGIIAKFSLIIFLIIEYVSSYSKDWTGMGNGKFWVDMNVFYAPPKLNL